MATTKKTTAKKTTAKKTAPAFSDDERAAMKERSKEAKRGRGASAEDVEADVLAKIKEMEKSDREMAEGIHALIRETVPDLEAKLWYGMPAYAKAGKTICFFQPAKKFKSRYATLGFSDEAKLDAGNFWPNAYALTELTAAEEKKIATLLKKAVR